MNSKHRIDIGRRVLSVGLGQGVTLHTRDRATHMHIVGASGQGKTTAIEHMILQDIYAGRGVALIDPMGDLVDRILDRIPPERINETLVFNPSDTTRPIPFNILALTRYAEPSKVKSLTIGALRNIWYYSWGPELENILSKSISTLLEVEEEPTFLGIERLLIDGEYRFRCVNRLRNPDLVRYWMGQYDSLTQIEQLRRASSTLNKVGRFAEPPLKNIVGQGSNTYDIRTLVDKQKILLVDLSQGSPVMGFDQAKILGSLWITLFQIIGFSRSDLPEGKRKPFFVYVDEFADFTSQAFVKSLSQLRAFGISFILSHQYLGQLPDEKDNNVREAVLGNIGTLLAFRVGAEDSQVLSKQFDGEVHPNQLTELRPGHAYMKRRMLKEELPFKVKISKLSRVSSIPHQGHEYSPSLFRCEAV